MHHQPLQAFIDLVTFDQSLGTLRTTITQIQNEIQTDERLLSALDTAAQERKQALVQLRKNVDAAELDMKLLDTQEQEKKRLLAEVKGHKEYQALTKDLEGVHQKQLDCETRILQAWHQLESAQEQSAKQQAQAEEQRAEYHARLAAKREQMQQVEQELNAKVTQRDRLVHEVPSQWLTKYTMMQSRVNNPVVPVRQGSCSACFVALPAQDKTLLRHNALIECRNCFRFLYLDDHETA